MKAEKLPSGKWRVQIYLGKDANGVKRKKSITAPTKREALQQAAVFKLDESADMQLKEACEHFIAVRGPELSPATVRGYMGVYRQHIKDNMIGCVTLRALTTPKLQKWISEMDLSAKSKRNALGFVVTVVRFFDPERMFRVKILDTRQEELYTPTIDDVNKVLAIADEETRKGILLGIFGLRRGEICALTAEDLDRSRCQVRVNKDTVKDDDGRFVVKVPKTRKSIRWVDIPACVMDQLPEEGRLLTISPDMLTNRFRRLVLKAGVHPFRFHDLRAFFASVSVSSAVGASELTVQSLGGWSTPHVLKRHYEREISDLRRRDTAAIMAYFDAHLKMGTS